MPLLEKYSSEKFAKDFAKLCRKISPYKPFIKSVYPASKQGVLLAVAIENKFKIPVVIDRDKVNEKTLVIDWLLPDPKFEKFLQNNTYHSSASMLCRKSSSVKPMFVGSTISDEVNIQFPWQK